MGGDAVPKQVKGLVAAVCAATALTACSSGDGAPGNSRKAQDAAVTKSTAFTDPASALAAAPGAVKAARTLALDDTGSVNALQIRATAQFDFTGAPKGGMDLAVTGGTPRPDDSLALGSSVIVSEGSDYELAATMLGAKTSGDAATVVARLKGKHWLVGMAGGGDDLHALRTYLLFGLLAHASDGDPQQALAALLASGVLRPDAAAGPGGTFHYTGALDKNTMKTAAYPAKLNDGIMDEVRTTGAADKIEVWLAPDGLPTEIKYTETGDAGLGGGPQSGDVKLTWNKPVSILAPTSSDVASQADINSLYLSVQS